MRAEFVHLWAELYQVDACAPLGGPEKWAIGPVHSFANAPVHNSFMLPFSSGLDPVAANLHFSHEYCILIIGLYHAMQVLEFIFNLYKINLYL